MREACGGGGGGGGRVWGYACGGVCGEWEGVQSGKEYTCRGV